MTQATPTVPAEPREKLGRRHTARLRRQGKFPAVIYGHHEPPTHVCFDREKILSQVGHGIHVIQVDHGNGPSETCLVKDLQYDNFGTDIIHADLERVSLHEEVRVSIPVEVVNQDGCAALKQAGAVLEQPVTELEVICEATNVPERIDADISSLAAGDAITVGQLDLPAGVRTEHPHDAPVAHIDVVRGGGEAEEEATA